MNTYRSNALAAGVLFIFATAASLIANAIAKSLLVEPVDLTGITANQTTLFAAVLLKFAGYVACPAIALVLYPVLRKYSPSLALGSVGFRFVEASFYLAGAICLLLLVSLGQDAATSGAADASYFGHLAALLLAGSELIGFVAAVPFFCLGALAYYAILYRSSLVPRWLSGWGLVAAVLAIVASVLAMFGVAAPLSTAHILLNLPIALQEMVLAGWLIAKGFDPRAFASVPASTNAAAPVVAVAA
jgi:hypothetical protein